MDIGNEHMKWKCIFQMNVQEMLGNEKELDHELKLYPGQQKCSFLKHPASVSFTNCGTDGMILP